MRIIQYSYGQTPPDLPPLSAALGFFDGVHLGHRHLIRMAIEGATDGVASAVITFASEAQGLKSGSGRLYSTENRLDVFDGMGVDIAVILDFDSVKGLSPEDYVTRVLLEGLNCVKLYVGYNHRFGAGGAGSAEDLCRIAEGRAECRVIPEERLGDLSLSTTDIKRELAEGRLDTAARMLGEEYFILGRVERGLGIGKRSGFPTVNNRLPAGCPLPYGVYKTRVCIQGRSYVGLTNVGVCPTFGEREPHVETTLLDFDSSVYGEEVRISFLRFIRPEMSFGSAEELREQIERDKLSALSDENSK